MTTEAFKRKLTAILSADVEGYSRLMGEDEDATIRTLTIYRELMSTLIQKHRGRVVDSPGDNLLAEFGSVVDAVRCAVEIQEELRVRNAELPENRRMEFRIGINLGDVVEEGDRIYGDGVNIAARVEGLAEGGRICISGTVYDSIKNKLSLSYESLGEHTVKNIAEPVRVYRMRIGPEAAAPVAREEKAGPRRWKKPALAVVVVLLIVGGGFLVWNYYQQRSTEAALIAFEKEAALPLPEKPSIAVLAFKNLSGDPEQEYFSDGLSENIITRLARTINLFVIARESSFAYKGKPVDVRQVGRELGVRYVLEGSVQKAGERIRITAQLIDAAVGKHLWADSYDRELKDVFSVMDEITRRIITELAVKLTSGEQARISYNSTDNVAAFDLNLQGFKSWLRFEKESNHRAKQLFRQAIELDPNYAIAMAGLALAYLNDARWWGKDREESSQLAEHWARRALATDDTVGPAYQVLGRLYTFQRKYEQAIAAGERAVEVQPNDAGSHASLSLTMLYAGKPEEALVLIKKAMRLSPYYDITKISFASMAHFFTGRFEEGIPLHQECVRRSKGRVSLICQRYLIASYMKLGREDEARAEAKKYLQLDPKFSLKGLSNRAKRVFKDPAMINPLVEALRKAGLPD
jgi:TolB-like protein/class 3 adenylate cyclase